MSRRTGKFYSKNEKEVMERFGLKPTIASGATMLEKEDGYNDYLLCQHKSTDANSYRLSLDDMSKLEYHAMVEHKTPVFMVQFLKNDDVFLILRPENFQDVYDYLNIPKDAKSERKEPQIDISEEEPDIQPKRKMIKSGDKQKFNKMREKEQEKKNERYEEQRRAFKKISKR